MIDSSRGTYFLLEIFYDSYSKRMEGFYRFNYGLVFLIKVKVVGAGVDSFLAPSLIAIFFFQILFLNFENYF